MQYILLHEQTTQKRCTMEEEDSSTKGTVVIKPGMENLLAPAGEEVTMYLLGFPIKKERYAAADSFTPCTKTPIEHCES